jgi:hypothetical protein
MASLAEIRARLAAAESKQTGNNQSGDNQIYPHWNIAEGSTAKVRFLSDGNEKNPFFWVERAMIKLPFNGVKGEAENRQVIVQVPCVEMWNESCPILAEVRTWFKDKSLEEMGRKYWKKRSYLFQGFIRENPLATDKPPTNPIRRFVISPQIFTIIKSSLMNPEIEELPTDSMRGLDFYIIKTTKGGYADYSTSHWSRRETALTAEEQAAIKEHGLFNLADFLPKKPGEVELKVMKEMFDASVDGQSYDLERWGQYFKPVGLNAGAAAAATDTDDSVKPVAKAAKPAPVVEDPEEESAVPVAPVKAAPAAKSQKAEDILQMIRNRQSK